MAESLINSIARLRVIEKGLLTKDTVGRLVAAPSYEECLRLLREAGFGQNAASGEADEIDSIINSQLGEAYALINELMPAKNAFVTDAFRMRHDLTNVKLLYKLRLMGEPFDEAKLDFGGIYDEDELKKAIAKGDYSMLPKQLESALEELDVITYRGADPQKVSTMLDCAFFSFAASSKSPFVREYFGALADFTNVTALIRGAGADAMLPGGEYTKEELEKIKAALPDEKERALDVIKGVLNISPLRESLRAGFEGYIRTGHAAAIEKSRDEYLVGLASEGRSEIDSVKPIVGYMLAREREAEVIRLILTAKRSGIPMSAVDERSLKLYG